MSDDDDERLGRPDGHRYDAPESDETRVSKEWVVRRPRAAGAAC